jgi:hypothetical protein
MPKLLAVMATLKATLVAASSACARGDMFSVILIHAEIVTHATSVNRGFGLPANPQLLNPMDRGRTRGARCRDYSAGGNHRHYIDDYRLLMIATLAMFPLLPVCTRLADGGGEHGAVEL